MTLEALNPSGLCMCGCGRAAPLAQKTDTSRRMVQGQPLRFILGHHLRKSPVDYVVDENGCWVWQGAMIRGYACLRDGGRTRLGSRVFYEREHGAIPDGMEIDHLCRNTACVNPTHLEAVSSAVNSQRGCRTVLNPDSVREIRQSDESSVLLARRFGASIGAVEAARQRTTWRNVA